MHYLFSVIDDGKGRASATEMADIDAFNEKLIKNGHRVYAGGLGETDRAITIDNRSGEPSIVNGPFVKSDEWLAGLWIIDADNDDVALELALEASKCCNRKIEVRPYL